ncbi:MAG TPA: hypothetical protein DDX51_03830 [Clostridiales bacterium]|nr:hypothetical protein [Clostridiales bacterium]
MEHTNQFELVAGVLQRCTPAGTKLVLPEETRAIAEHAFSGCDKVTEIEISVLQLQLLAEHCFSACTALRRLSLWCEVSDAAGVRFSSRQTLRRYLGVPEETEVEWECPTVWCMEDRCQFCGGTLRNGFLRVCIFCGRMN